MEKLLIIDDSIPFQNEVDAILNNYYQLVKAPNGKKGLEILKKENVDAVILDLKLPDIYGLELLRRIYNEIDPTLPVIIITDYPDIPTAIEAIKIGGTDFMPKDFNRELLCRKITDSLKKRLLEKRLSALQQNINSQYGQLIYRSIEMKRVDLEITRNAMHDEHVLLFGETGTGKDLIAYEIHRRSRRSGNLFLEIPINSLSDTLLESELFGYEKGAFSGAEKRMAGKFETANGGTVYLPEISELSPKIQLKLLQFLQYKTISRIGQADKIKLDIKLIMASNANLENLCKEHMIREDFYYRMRAFTVYIPPLRERKDDIRVLADYFLEKFSKKYNKRRLCISEELYQYLINYHWKGNVRDLELLVQRAVITSEDSAEITIDNFQQFINTASFSVHSNPANYKHAEYCFRKEYFSKLLQSTDGNKTKAAESAGLSRQGLINILKELGID